MSNVFQIKRRLRGGAPVDIVPNTLKNGELAFSEVDNTLYYGDTDGTPISIGGSGAFVTLDTPQVVVGEKTFTGAVQLGNSAIATTVATTDSSNTIATTEFVQNVASVLNGGTF